MEKINTDWPEAACYIVRLFTKEPQSSPKRERRKKAHISSTCLLSPKYIVRQMQCVLQRSKYHNGTIFMFPLMLHCGLQNTTLTFVTKHLRNRTIILFSFRTNGKILSVDYQTWPNGGWFFFTLLNLCFKAINLCVFEPGRSCISSNCEWGKMKLQA